jgi:hypothetical protein
MIESTDLALVLEGGRTVGRLRVSCRPENTSWFEVPGIELESAVRASGGASAQVRLLEEFEYNYEISLDGDPSLARLEPRELFDSSTASLKHGRLRVGRSTGSVLTVVELADGRRATAEFEVRSRKLNYETQYRSMLRGIASEAAELLQSRFAPSSFSSFRPDHESDPATLYQRFAFAQSFLESDEFESALLLILNRPHHDYVATTTSSDPARSMRPTRRFARELVAPGPRQSVPGHAVLRTVPRQVRQTTFTETYDTIPNRFVKFALERWRDVARDVQRHLSERAPADRRGRREAARLEDRLMRALATPALTMASRLQSFPAENSVLQGRAGYREIMRAFLQCEAGAALRWADGEDLFKAGQRDVATLYEYWCFLELARIVGDLPGFSVDRIPLIEVSKEGLSLNLRRGGKTLLEGRGRRRGREVLLKLWFNKSFAGGKSGASWSVPLRPDCSLLVSPVPSLANSVEEAWLHFDAKYRIHRLVEGFRDDRADAADLDDATTKPLNTDLMKMHTYRDAIQRTAGAYVLYPGEDSNSVRHEQYHEILPGLGAFTLLPADDGHADSKSEAALSGFIGDVIDHIAAAGTNSARARYWAATAHDNSEPTKLEHHRLLRKPASDTKVLLGYIKSQEHLEWVRETGLYNLRADGRRGSVGLGAPELSADLLLLYCEGATTLCLARLSGKLVIQSAEELVALGYPAPRGSRYACHEIGDHFDVASIPAHLLTRVRACATPPVSGEPVVLTWGGLDVT